MDALAYYPLTLSFREREVELAYVRYRISRTLSVGDVVYILVRLTIITTYMAVATSVPTYKFAAFDVVCLILQGSLVFFLNVDTYIKCRDYILLTFRAIYFTTAALGIPHHLYSLPMTNTPSTAFRIALLGSGAINNALIGLGMPQMLKLFHLVQAACVLGMALMVNNQTCSTILTLPDGASFILAAWSSIASKLQLISSYWVGLPISDLTHARIPQPHKQCCMLLATLHFWVGFIFPTAAWYMLERNSRQSFLQTQPLDDHPELQVLQHQLDTPWYLLAAVWLLVALLVFCAVWDVLHTFT